MMLANVLHRISEVLPMGNIKYSYINDEGQRVSGSAALLHEIYTVHGGTGNFYNYIGSKFITSLIDSLSPEVQKSIERVITRSQLKLVK